MRLYNDNNKYKVINRKDSYELREYKEAGACYEIVRYCIYFVVNLPESEGGGTDSVFMGDLSYASSFESAVDDLEEELRVEMAAMRREFAI
tara:strand:- start:698 stop:970 length:273 start_codon:yes stop_codon:yes gene_type:complete